MVNKMQKAAVWDVAREVMEYSVKGNNFSRSQISAGKSHNLFMFDINKRYRLKGEKQTASGSPGTFCGTHS